MGGRPVQLRTGGHGFLRIVRQKEFSSDLSEVEMKE